MRTNAVKYVGFGLAIAFVLGLAASQTHSEITVNKGQEPPHVAPGAEAKAPTSEPLKQSASLWVQCWQYGVKIIDEKNVFGIRLQNLIERDSLGFKGRDANNGDIYVIPVNGDSTCLIKPVR